MPHGSRLRPIVLATRQQLADSRQQLRQQHDRGLDGARVCARFTTMVDGAILKLYDAYLGERGEAEAAEARERISLVAHGGYGRRQQAPYSDVDLMLLYEGKLDELVSDFAGRLTRDICDIALSLGHSVRTPAEAIQRARSDPQIATSLLESRLLVGNSAIYSRYLEAMQNLVQRRGPALAQAFIAERRKERLQYGETVYLLEPNVKRSRGGLRDLHLYRWLWYVKCQIADPDQLHNRGLLSKFDYRRLISAQNFLLRVRNEMHFHAVELCDSLSRT
ncbi:MAG: [protein-PII] uridylyltransferase, partial [Planctomycetes bacterium]|nr:[protein-PII] uridylyltransferase [Planctomycetota bacterium]